MEKMKLSENKKKQKRRQTIKNVCFKYLKSKNIVLSER